MKLNNIANYRLINQQLVSTEFSTPEALVSYMGASFAKEAMTNNAYLSL